jgi:excisionase family DNA binding protein
LSYRKVFSNLIIKLSFLSTGGNMEGDYLSVKEVAKMLGLSAPSVYRYVSLGLLPSIQICGKILIPKDDLAAKLESSMRGQAK